MNTTSLRASKARLHNWAVALGLAVMAASCSDAVSDVAGEGMDPSFAEAPTTMAIDPAGATIGVGQSITLVARDQNGDPIPVQWFSINSSVATVTSAGVLTGRRVGRVLISARWGNQSRYSTSSTFTVQAAAAPVIASVALAPASATMDVGGSAQLVAQARDANGQVMTGVTFAWSSSNASVATVSSSGLVSGVGAGGAVVTATAGGFSATSSITVNAPPPPPPPPTVASVAVSPATVTMNQGATAQLSAQARDAAGNVMTGISFTWTSSNPAIATVSANGTVSGVAGGTAQISASASGHSGSASVTVNATTPPPPPPPPSGTRRFLFTSDWSTASGQTTTAKTDGSRWNIISDPGNGLSVVSCQSLGFPSATCLQVVGIQSATGFARLAKTGMPVPNAGESMYFRWYYRHEQRSLGDNSQHPIESGQAGGLDWSFNTETMSDNTWRPEFRPGGEQSNAVLARFTGPVLQRGVTYRIEMQIHKISTTQFYLHARIYDAAGNLIASDADFTNDRLGSSTRLSLASNPVLRFATSGGTNLHEIRAGVNGIAGSDWFPQHLYSYQGGLAVCAGDWCGAYAAGEGR